MGKGGIAPTWEGYQTMVKVEKEMAFVDTLDLAIYGNPERYAPHWSEATSGQREDAHRSFLKSSLPEREGPRSRAKTYVFPQRERNADDPVDETIKDVCRCSVSSVLLC